MNLTLTITEVLMGSHEVQSCLSLFQATSVLAHLSIIDIIIIASYFVMVVWIGFYLKGRPNTGVDFFMAGRQMTVWIAGLSFLSANPGSLERMGGAGSDYEYGILAAHWGAIPSMLFVGLVMIPFYYISYKNSVPGYLKLCFGSRLAFCRRSASPSLTNMFAMSLNVTRAVVPVSQ